ncbi:MAG: type III pantothenate kinase [Alphaproteobacteria bacterium PRO2]|nr:type III pantothenate kinase [Alphaproteobacteria bacterium PRO2]
MLLAIDIGNTNTVFAVYSGEKLLAHWRCQSIATRSADEYAAFLQSVFSLEGLDWKKLSDVIVSSVVPEADFHIKKFCKKYLKKKPLLVGYQDVPLKIDLDRPEEVGADRLVNALAIKEFYKVPAIVIDFGTATTFDVIDAKGRYAGGAIAPGINLSVEALHRAAAKLPRVNVKRPRSVIGKSTVSAIQSGIFFGYLGLIEGIVANISKEIGAKPFVIATGGLAPLFEPHTKIIQAVDDELTLKGLLRIYQHHKKRKK